MSENGPESALCAPGRGDRLVSAEAFLIASSIMAVRPPLSGLGVVPCRPKGPSDGATALIPETPETLTLAKLICEGFVLRAETGDEGESTMSVVGLAITTSFSSNTGSVFSVAAETADFSELALVKFSVGRARLPEDVFLSSIGRAVTFRATIELLLMVMGLAPDDLFGVIVEAALGLGLEEPPCLTLTTLACPRNAC